ncbi:MBL fold metallo-hydrolase [Aneurinibacillus sp. Ricciae_BoGa-3]|uniref:MBL fold metallo-hydrolase n=1 Tax=Aneurinibacillus sp. Ricciae_BoGa-3 TaxID=3022697 RepID=UPI002340BFBF|nr:MBL fold metallo-hydrolase [Aneurinibacillus sp. Ricciae_BoGa-3]WCK56153.1 MBL fold metallo-hydrolase [Aneurinibacillus sp. Ricciae_BoGa-3]
MKITVLGYQTPAPGPGGAGPGYLLETSSGVLLLDCGSAVYARLMQYFPVHKIDAVLVSHYHHDHVCDIPILQYGALMASVQQKLTKPIPVYGPQSPQAWADRMAYETHTKFLPIDEQTTLAIGGVSISFHRTQHAVECYAMKINDGVHTIVYTADTGPDTEWKDFADECDLLICEGTFTTDIVPGGKRGHLTAKEATELSERVKAKRLLITHLSPDIARSAYLEDARGGFRGELSLADIGQVITIE